MIVLDAGDNELRDMNWDIRILRADAPNATPDPETSVVGRLPLQKLRNGMVNFDHSFDAPGNYVLYVKFTSDDGAKSYIGQHPFSVGLVTDNEMYLYAAFAVFALILSGVIGAARTKITPVILVWINRGAGAVLIAFAAILAIGLM